MLDLGKDAEGAPVCGSFRHEQFIGLARRAKTRKLCGFVNPVGAIIGEYSGKVYAPVMFVAEAPGRLGACVTHTPLSGDATGNNFHKLLDVAGLTNLEYFVTNAVLCNPVTAKGTNSWPTTMHIKNCYPFLEETISVIEPTLVVALGTVALRALNYIEHHELSLPNSVGKIVPWFKRHLTCLYNRSPLAMKRRTWKKQCEDYKILSMFISTFITGTHLGFLALC